ncbi:MaoC/PaaZ C-terminal domain-containing protein [Gordonia sp. CPCC 206044]|uniref:MaoC family dehydratase n=1 Tax=Gordonia sp. CPCC 206044 TaxID=3140793 RepID=UPI003AF38FA5
MSTPTSAPIEVGQEIPERVVDVDPARMKTLSALMRDPNPIHFDSESTNALGLGDRTVNQGPSNVAYVVSALGAWVGVHNVVSYRFRYLANVFAGDRVRAGGRVDEITDTTEGPIAHCAVWLDVDGGTRALEGAATVRLPHHTENTDEQRSDQ